MQLQATDPFIIDHTAYDALQAAYVAQPLNHYTAAALIDLAGPDRTWKERLAGGVQVVLVVAPYINFGRFSRAAGGGTAPKGGLRLVDRANVVRNVDALSGAQIAELRTMAGQLGLGPDDIRFVRTPSAYSDLFDRVLIGPNVYPSAAGSGSRSVLGRLTPRAVIAHEGGHLLTSRAGKALQGGSLLDEVQASLVARQMRGLSNVERYQLLRDAVERARSQGQRVRDLLPQLPYFAD